MCSDLSVSVFVSKLWFIATSVPCTSILSAFLTSSPFLAQIKCIYSGHEMPANLELLEKYVSTKKYRSLRDRSTHDFSRYEANFIVPGRAPQTFYCTITKMVLKADSQEIQRHMNGKKYKSALAAHQGRLANEAAAKEIKREKIRIAKENGWDLSARDEDFDWEDSANRDSDDDSNRFSGNGKRRSNAQADIEDLSDLYPSMHDAKRSKRQEDSDDEQHHSPDPSGDEDDDHDERMLELFDNMSDSEEGDKQGEDDGVEAESESDSDKKTSHKHKKDKKKDKKSKTEEQDEEEESKEEKRSKKHKKSKHVASDEDVEEKESSHKEEKHKKDKKDKKEKKVKKDKQDKKEKKEKAESAEETKEVCSSAESKSKSHSEKEDAKKERPTKKLAKEIQMDLAPKFKSTKEHSRDKLKEKLSKKSKY